MDAGFVAIPNFSNMPMYCVYLEDYHSTGFKQSGHCCDEAIRNAGITMPAKMIVGTSPALLYLNPCDQDAVDAQPLD